MRHITSFSSSTFVVLIMAVVPSLPGDDANVESDPRPLLVQVVDDAGLPLAGVKVHCNAWTNVPAPYSNSVEASTDVDGEVTFDVPSSLNGLRLWADKEGYVPLFVDFLSGVPGCPEFPTEFTFTLVPATTIGGRVLNELNEPVKGARVEVMLRQSEIMGTPSPNTWLATEQEACITDETGRWTLDNVPTGDDLDLRLWLTHPEYVSDRAWRNGDEGKEFTLEQLRGLSATSIMETGVRVSGTVTDPGGDPVSNAMIIWGDNPYYTRHAQEAFTDADGVYVLPPLAKGPTLLTIVARGYAPQLTTVEVGSPDAVTDFQLESGRTIRLQFVDADGNPLSEVGVGVDGWRGRRTLFNHRHPNVPYSGIPDRSDESGLYEWTWAPKEAVELSFGKEGYAWLIGEFGPGEHTVILHESE